MMTLFQCSHTCFYAALPISLPDFYLAEVNSKGIMTFVLRWGKWDSEADLLRSESSKDWTCFLFPSQLLAFHPVPPSCRFLTLTLQGLGQGLSYFLFPPQSYELNKHLFVVEVSEEKRQEEIISSSEKDYGSQGFGFTSSPLHTQCWVRHLSSLSICVFACSYRLWWPHPVQSALGEDLNAIRKWTPPFKIHPPVFEAMEYKSQSILYRKSLKHELHMVKGCII